MSEPRNPPRRVVPDVVIRVVDGVGVGAPRSLAYLLDELVHNAADEERAA